MSSYRMDRVARIIQEDLARICRGYVTQLDVFVTIVEVKVTNDFGMARVYLSIVGNQASAKKTLEYLQECKKNIRKELALSIKNQFKRIPDLEFYVDEQAEKVRRIEELIQLTKLSDELPQ